MHRSVCDGNFAGEGKGQGELHYRSLVENIPDVVYSLDKSGTLASVNQAVAAYGYTREALIGRHFADFIHPLDRDRVVHAYLEVIAAQKDRTRTQQFRVRATSGDVRWFEANCTNRFDAKGRFIRQEGVCRDITERVQDQTTLIKVQEALEEQVRIRTSELLQANMELQKEIDERRATEKRLLDRETELMTEKVNLQEVNTALKVLLKRRETDKRALEERVMYNVKKLVMPYLNKIKKESADASVQTYLDIVESNMGDITCGFSRHLSMQFYGLSTAELKVASFIRQGKKNREIADLLKLSIRTVEAYRQSIRSKLRLQNKKVNLRTFLLSIA
jgi:PAS domain S-box-containing protein